MKKIFAIALAAVMVLSMASAFAVSDCTVWGNNWPCDLEDNTPWCGQGKVEVVPLVKVNTACGWEFQVNECAGAVRSDFIYYAIKLTVDAYPDRDWWTQAGLSLEFWGDDDAVVDVALPISEEDVDAVPGELDMDAKKAITYYGILTESEVEGEQGTETVVEPVWVDLDNDDDEYVEGILALIDDIDEDEAINFKEMAWVTPVPSDDPAFCKNWPDYKICATLASFYDGGSVDGYNKLGDYYYAFEEEYPEFADMDEVEDDNDGFTGALVIWTLDDDEEVENLVVFNVNKGAIGVAQWFFDADENEKNDYKDNDKFYTKVMEDFGFAACGTAPCVTYLNVQKNFGWNDSQEDCFEWSTKAAAVVDAECVVAIPKTGDASLLAWLF